MERTETYFHRRACDAFAILNEITDRLVKDRPSLNLVQIATCKFLFCGAQFAIAAGILYPIAAWRVALVLAGLFLGRYIVAIQKRTGSYFVSLTSAYLAILTVFFAWLPLLVAVLRGRW